MRSVRGSGRRWNPGRFGNAECDTGFPLFPCHSLFCRSFSSMFLDHRAAFRHRLAERFPGFSECGCVTHRKHFAADDTQPTQRDEGGGGGVGAGGRTARCAQGVRGRGCQGWRVFDAILNRLRTLCLMFGHVFRPGHAFCYHFPCTFVRLKCCSSARAATPVTGVARERALG